MDLVVSIALAGTIFFINSKLLIFEHKYFLLLFSAYLTISSFSFFNVLNIDDLVRQETTIIICYFLVGYFLSLIFQIFFLKDPGNKQVELIFYKGYDGLLLIYLFFNIVVFYPGFSISKSSINGYLEGNPSVYFIISILSVYYYSNKRFIAYIILFLILFLISFYSDSRLLLIPFLFSTLFVRIKKGIPIKFLMIALCLFGIIALVRVGVTGENPFEALITVFGEFVFTRHSMDLALENLSGTLNFSEYIKLILPARFQTEKISSIDALIANAYDFDFGLASAYLNDFILLQKTKWFFIVFGFFQGWIIYFTSQVIRKYLKNELVQLITVCFFSTFPLMFRSGFYYSIAVLYSILLFVTFLVFIKIFLQLIFKEKYVWNSGSYR